MRWLITVLAIAGLAVVAGLVFLPLDSSRIDENSPLLIDPFGGSIAWYSDSSKTLAAEEKAPAVEIRPGTIVEKEKTAKMPEEKDAFDPFFYLWP